MTEKENSDVRLQNRRNSHVALPAVEVLDVADLFVPTTVGTETLPMNLERLRNHFWNEGRITEDAAMEISYRASEILNEESNLVELVAPVTIFGDIHGQYYDLVNSLKKIDLPKESDPLLFLGDYVDRGSFSCEVILLLFAMKICYPRGVYLLRGNHECRHLGNHYSFKKECLAKYKSQQLFDSINSAFDFLPLAALIDAGNMYRFLALHGGLSPEIFTLDDIRDLDRKNEPPHKGAICDILWSDPLEDETGNGLDPDTMQEWYAVEYEPNPTRGCGYVFGYKATIDFLERNQLTSVIRAHDVKREGYCEHHMHCKTGRRFPLVITIFSAPNYCGYYENQAARLRLLPAKRNFGDETPRSEQIEDVQINADLPQAPIQEYDNNDNDIDAELEKELTEAPKQDPMEEEIVNLDTDPKMKGPLVSQMTTESEPSSEITSPRQPLDFVDSMAKFVAKRQSSLESLMKKAIPSLDLKTIGSAEIPRDDISTINTPVEDPDEVDDSTENESEADSHEQSAPQSPGAEEDQEEPAVEQPPEEPIDEVVAEQINPDFLPKLMFMTYTWIPSPFWLPSFENAIQYSLSYVTDRVVQILNSVLTMDVDDNEGEYKVVPQRPRFQAPKTEEIAQLLSPRPTPQAQNGVVPLTYRQAIAKGSVKNKIKDLEIKRTNSHRMIPYHIFVPSFFVLCLVTKKIPSDENISALKRRKSLTLLDGAFKQKFSNYIAAAENRFDSIKRQDRLNELRPPIDLQEEEKEKERLAAASASGSSGKHIKLTKHMLH